MAESGSSNSTASDEPRSGSLTGTFLAVAAITTIVGFAAFFATWLKASIDPGQATLEIAVKQYALGHYVTSAELARQAVLTDESSDDLKQLREYLIGASLANEAFLTPETSVRRAALHVALPHLKAASTAWPLGRDDEGDRLLGLTLFNIGAYKEAIRSLKACVGRNPTYREELTPTLARCYLYGEKEAATDALRMLDKQVEMLPAGSKLLDETQWLRAECFLRLGRFDEARKTLKVLEERSPKNKFNASAQAAELATRVKLLLAIADVSEAIERFGKGISEVPVPRPEVAEFLAPSLSVLESLRLDATPEFANQASLWAARAYGCEGDAESSLSLLAEVRQQQPFTGANIAAGIEELEWLAGMGNGEEALQTVRYLLREIGNEQNYDGSLVDLESFRTRVIAALQTLRQKERFKHCIAIAQTLPVLLPETDAVYEEAITYRAIADQIISTKQGANKEIEPEALLAAKQQYRKAGDALAKSAKLRFDSKRYCDTLWEAIEAYQLSGQFELCIELLENYLRYEQRSMQPRALLAMGKARLATGKAAESLSPLGECIVEFPRDPLRYDARLAAAMANAELNRFDDAKQLLDANLSDGGLTPESTVWRDSLYALGDLLFRQGHEGHLAWGLENASVVRATKTDLTALRDKQPVLEEAVLRLGEASTRYWPDARAKHAAYLAARANKLAAVWPRLESEATGVLDVAKRQLRLKADQHLNLALNGFINLRRDLALREEEAMLTQAQQSMLRNCYVEEADTLFELGKYEQAAEAFRAVSLRYMNEPTALEAMLGQARCLERLERPREARMIIRQATVVLGRIPPEADERFLETTRYDRKRWQELLGWLDASPLPDDSDA
jgi:tetratricopeptide (TPR) repeat protein